ncbi:MAG: hypothetical protein K2G45_00075 [Lachnospiraceae bacterium]|nr:hypothetical protein [Lachnospiraceae bacterium]
MTIVIIERKYFEYCSFNLGIVLKNVQTGNKGNRKGDGYMRITSQMLNQNMKKAGVGGQRRTLLDYIKTGKSSNLFNIMNTKAGTAVNTAERTKYEKLDKAADKVVSQVEKLASDKEDSVMNKAKESGDRTQLYKDAEALIDNYNDMLSAMKFATGNLNSFYRKSIKELVEENKEQLAGIGITAGSDGRLNIDKSKFNDADFEKVEQMLGNKSSFLSKLAFVSQHIGDNAAANVETTSSSYLPNGVSSRGRQNRYDFKG